MKRSYFHAAKPQSHGMSIPATSSPDGAKLAAAKQNPVRQKCGKRRRVKKANRTRPMKAPWAMGVAWSLPMATKLATARW